MRRFLRRHFNPNPGLLFVALLLASIAAAFVPSRPAVAEDGAEDGMVTLRGDLAAEAKEREELFAALAKASSPREARALSAKIWALWFRAPDTDAAGLMREALEHRAARDYPGSVVILDTLVAAAPEWAEGWNQRATLRYLLRDFEGSLSDIDRVLAIEPKHFGALSGQALILMHQGKMAEGQSALREAVEIDPFLSERALLMPPAGQDI